MSGSYNHSSLACMQNQDLSDSQWRNFRSGLPALTGVMAAFTVLGAGLRTGLGLKGKGMAWFWLLMSLVYVTYLHGLWCVFSIKFFLFPSICFERSHCFLIFENIVSCFWHPYHLLLKSLFRIAALSSSWPLVLEIISSQRCSRYILHLHDLVIKADACKPRVGVGGMMDITFVNHKCRTGGPCISTCKPFKQFLSWTCHFGVLELRIWPIARPTFQRICDISTLLAI